MEKVKNFVRMKTDIRNDVVEKVNTDYERSRKEFWAFGGRKSKGAKKTISSLRSDKGVSVTRPGVSYMCYKRIISTWVG